jgi:two-component system, sensor histidine kinase and response regulator
MSSLQQQELQGQDKSMMEGSFSILLVEDNPGDVLIIRELLNSSGIVFHLTQVSTLKETLFLCAGNNYDVILLDLGLPDSVGMETLKKIQLFNFKSPVVVMTGLDDEDSALEALREGAQDYLVKNRLTTEGVIRGIKYGIERKKIQDLLKKNASQFALLSSATALINECDEISSIYSVTCNHISKLIEKAGVIAIEFGPQLKFHFAGIECIEPWIDQIKQFTGFNASQNGTQISHQNTGMFDLVNVGKLHKIDDTLLETFKAGISPEHNNDTFPLKCLNIYQIGFARASNIFGGVFIFSGDLIGNDEISIIETISNQVSLCLQRKIIEKELKSSEDRYRKLSQELDIKVRERTRELETSNYNLNQELVERQIAEEALKKSEIRLKELNATKDKFFSIIAHDMKNPFTSLLGSTELLSGNINNLDPEGIKKLVQILSDSAKSGYAILQNLLDWSRSQTGMITYNPERFDLKNLIDVNISVLMISAAKKEINLFSGVEEAMIIYADKNLINTVLRNLISNAIKFTQRFGTVEVNALLKGYEVIISVKDTGIGIAEENIEKLFRIDIKYTRPGTDKEQGTGLGLKLCKEFVELQNGRIWVESVVNKGSEFLFSIPLKQPDYGPGQSTKH